jgi:hypothetical protein
VHDTHRLAGEKLPPKLRMGATCMNPACGRYGETLPGATASRAPVCYKNPAHGEMSPGSATLLGDGERPVTHRCLACGARWPETLDRSDL